MSARIFYTISVLAFGFVTSADAQSLRNTDGPAEIPTTEFAGKQYVDSRGCVFVRAGFGEDVVWVPRVTRDRKLLCGFAPSENAASAAPKQKTVTPEIAIAASAVVEKKPVTNVAALAVAPSTPIKKRNKSAGMMADGVKPAWTDDRLNMNRGPRTEAGDLQMALIWSNTIPRKLISPDG